MTDNPIIIADLVRKIKSLEKSYAFKNKQVDGYIENAGKLQSRIAELEEALLKIRDWPKNVPAKTPLVNWLHIVINDVLQHRSK